MANRKQENQLYFLIYFYVTFSLETWWFLYQAVVKKPLVILNWMPYRQPHNLNIVPTRNVPPRNVQSKKCLSKHIHLFSRLARNAEKNTFHDFFHKLSPLSLRWTRLWREQSLLPHSCDNSYTGVQLYLFWFLYHYTSITTWRVKHRQTCGPHYEWRLTWLNEVTKCSKGNFTSHKKVQSRKKGLDIKSSTANYFNDNAARTLSLCSSLKLWQRPNTCFNSAEFMSFNKCVGKVCFRLFHRGWKKRRQNFRASSFTDVNMKDREWNRKALSQRVPKKVSSKTKKKSCLEGDDTERRKLTQPFGTEISYECKNLKLQREGS